LGKQSPQNIKLANCRLTNGHLANRRCVKKFLLKVFPKQKVLNATQQNDFHLSIQKILSFFDEINFKKLFFPSSVASNGHAELLQNFGTG
jgi:hypothetical protein